MEQEETAVALYDFLYRDSGRIASFYAQLFGGHLASLEDTTATRDTKERSGRASISVFGGEVKSGHEVGKGSKRTVDPHDLNVTTVLAELRERKHLHQGHVKDARHGALVIAKGTLTFIDRSMLELAAVGFDAVIEAEMKKPRNKRDTATLDGFKLIRQIMGGITMPSAFLLQTEDGIQVVGTIKEAGMEEPISTYYFKHGNAGLSDVHVVGIKEIPAPAFYVPGSQLMGAGQQAAQALTDMMFPKEAMRVTPIAMFREL